jgi:manganese/zinc/iron transport system substrate-binding protein
MHRAICSLGYIQVPSMPTSIAILRVILLVAATGIGLIVGACGISGCRDSDATAAPRPDADARPLVVATTGMVADLVRGVGGDRVRVETLIAPGTDPHLYKPTRTDLGRIVRADLLVANGLHLEGRLDEALRRAEDAGRRVCRVADDLPRDRLLADEAGDHADPHVWMDPSLFALAIAPIRAALSEIAPAHAATFRTNAERLTDDLAALDAETEAALALVPPHRRVLVTAHDAFGYLGRRYGFEVVGIQGISTESEAGVRDLRRLVDLLVERDLPAVFVESTVPPRQVEALIAGAAARGRSVSIGGELFSDAMGAAGTPEGTYPGMIRHNARTIAEALGVPDP